MTQQNLPLARATDPQSSHEAAREVRRTGRHARQMEAVREAITCHPGETSAELAESCGLDRYMVARRTADLEHRGIVRKGPMRTCLVSGRKAVTWWPV